MDISRLPVTPLLWSASAPTRTPRQPAPVQAGERLGEGVGRQSDRGTVERVLQGELLQRESTAYQSTRAFIDERNLELAQPVGWQNGSFNRSATAISRYLNNTGPDAAAGFSQGRSVNFFA